MNAFDERECELGEGLLWHPERNELFWFDILGRTLHARKDDQARSWRFDERVSAAGWVDQDTLLIASETGFLRFDLATGNSQRVADLEADNDATRSNDGRADPQGGLWIGTMGLEAEPGAGAIYRFWRGEVRRMFPDITIPNSICFTPDGKQAYFSDTPTHQVRRVDLNADGWPVGVPEILLDLRADGLNPDGAEVDVDGNIWLAEWGSARVRCYGPDGGVRTTVDFPTRNTTCAGFGGAGMDTLFCTSARIHMTAEERAADPYAGMTFSHKVGVRGQAAHRVLL